MWHQFTALSLAEIRLPHKSLQSPSYHHDASFVSTCQTARFQSHDIEWEQRTDEWESFHLQSVVILSSVELILSSIDLYHGWFFSWLLSGESLSHCQNSFSNQFLAAIVPLKCLTDQEFCSLRSGSDREFPPGRICHWDSHLPVECLLWFQYYEDRTADTLHGKQLVSIAFFLVPWQDLRSALGAMFVTHECV